jgi:pre-mRNA-splicing helicase BRR2
LDLEKLKFSKGSHYMSNKKVNLPPDSYRVAKQGYEEIHIPALKNSGQGKDVKLIRVDQMP